MLFISNVPQANGGSTGDVVGPASATNNNIAVFDGITGKLIKDGGTTIATINSAISAKQDSDADLTAIAALSTTGIAVRTAANTWATRDMIYPAAGLTITNSAGIAGNPTFALANDLAALEGLTGTGVANRTAADTWTTNTLDTDVTLAANSDSNIATQKATKTYVDNMVAGLLDYRGGYDASGNVFPSTGGSGTAGAVLKGDMWVISVAGTLGGTAVQIGDSLIANVDTPGQTAGNWNVLNGNISYVPEDVANKSTSTSLGTSDTLYPSQNAVKVYADTKALLAGSVSQAFTVSQLELGNASDTTLTRVSAGIMAVEGATVVTNASSPTLGTVTTTGGIELGNASDTTLSRAAAGIIAVEGTTINGYATTATAAGTTTLTIASATTQIFTGSTTQTVVLPTTSVLAGQTYRVRNNSTGNVTVQSSGANTIQIIGAGMEARFTAIVNTPTTAANWTSDLEDFSVANLATTATANAATINLAAKTNTITNNSAATLTITLPTAGAIDGEMRIVRVLDFSAVAQTLAWVNTEDSTTTAPTTSNASTTLPLTVGFQYNAGTSKWRTIAKS